jgi:serine protease Do
MWNCAVVSVIALSVAFSGVVRGEEPAQSQDKVQLTIPALSSEQGLASTLQLLANPGALNLVTVTYGNALGVEIAEVDATLRTQLGLDERTGVVVTSVNKESEAAKAGLAQHDLVLKAGEKPIGSPKEFHDVVAGQQGKDVTFHLLRKGKPATVSVKVSETPVYSLAEGNLSATLAGGLVQLVDVAGEISGEGEKHYRIGLQLAEADDTLRSQLRLAAGEGLVVTEVVADWPAAKAGIQKNDVLTKLDGRRLTKIEAVNAQIQEIKDRKVTLTFFRGGSETTCEVTPKLVSEPNYRIAIVSEIDNLVRLQQAAPGIRYLLEAQAGGEAKVAIRPSVAEQLANLKKQLADVQKSLAALEAALEAAPAEKPAVPEEKK